MFTFTQTSLFDLSAALTALGRRYQQSEASALGGLVAPGRDAIILRLNTEGPIAEPLTWSTTKPWETATDRPILNGCLIPASSISDETHGELLPASQGSELLLAGSMEMTPLGPIAFSLVLSSGKHAGLPILVPRRHWMDWLLPDRDVRQLHRPTTRLRKAA